MSSVSSENIIPKKFNLSSLGSGEITEVLHQGKMFNVYRAVLNGQDVVLKTPAPNSEGEMAFVKSISAGSEDFCSISQGLRPPEQPLKIATWFLLEESQTINSTKGAWNHEIIALGTWDGFSRQWTKGSENFNYDEPLDLRFMPVLVMPYYEAVTFSSLPNSAKKLLFPKMLPALWDALCQQRHGDLSESNLLINQTKNIFHIIDPGVYLSSDIGDFGHPLLSFFITNPANYPLIAPFSSPSHKETGLANSLMKLSFPPAIYPPRPSACDLLALGLLYYRILTGKEFFTDEDVFAEMPVWSVRWSSPFFQQDRLYMEIYKILSAGYIQNKLEKSPVSPSEKHLLQALINLEIFDKAHLVKLISGL